MAAPQGAMPPSSSLAVGAGKTVRATGLGTALTKQKVANIRKRMQKRKGKRKANSDDDYVFSAEEMESEEDTGVHHTPPPRVSCRVVSDQSESSGWWGYGKRNHKRSGGRRRRRGHGRPRYTHTHTDSAPRPVTWRDVDWN
jgi:hypothetical protein